MKQCYERRDAKERRKREKENRQEWRKDAQGHERRKETERQEWNGEAQRLEALNLKRLNLNLP